MSVMFDEISTPYTRRFEDGAVYEWPSIPYMTQTRGCLRMTFNGGGWCAYSYRDYPMPLDELGPILEPMILANPCFKITFKEFDTKQKLKAGDEFDGGIVVSGNCEHKILRYKEYADGSMEPVYSKRLTLIPGAKARVEYREEVKQ